ncbi:MAG TPA: branched-chain amino acid ABC transporter permease [Candidatus Deferrimicrobiaceae bacterium]|jgi:branched-chain amino acid transport system permease protein|nr:branched-chain amino acid ABC transporter permease [Candidatus Deferrimicrobiaceae bacterium]
MDISVATIALTLVWGVAIGCVYILLATGLNIIFGVMKLVNFAHGQLLMIGAFLTWTISVMAGINAYVAILISMIVVALIGVGVERLTFRRVLGTDKLNEIFVSLGLIYVFENVAILLWGVNSKQVVSPFYGLSVSFQGVSMTYDRIIAVFVVIASLVAFGVLMKKTKIGLAMRATSQRNTTAMLMGINVERVYMLTFAIGAALAAVAGGLYGIIFSFDYQVGAMPTIIAFAIIIMGGLGSIKGAIVGGLLYGITEQLATLFFGGIWGSAVAFALLIVVLVLRPNGIFGEKGD